MVCYAYGYFILGCFLVGHIMQCRGEIPVDKMSVDKMPVTIASEDKMIAI